MTKKRIEFAGCYKDFLTDNYKARYVVITGGRGSGKSFAVGSKLCIDTAKRPSLRTLFTRYTMSSANISIIPEFTEKIDLFGLSPIFNIQRTSIECTQTGSDIIFRGIKTSSGNQTANLKSIQGVTTFVVEEAEELDDESIFDNIDLSIRKKGVKNTVVLILNPTTKDHWIWKRWFENHLKYIEIEGFQIPVSNHPDVLHIHTTYHDNEQNLDQSFLDRVRKIREENPEKYRNKILGGFLERAEGVVFENWIEGKFDESLPSVFGLDLGYYPDPLAMVEVAVDKRRKKIYLREKLYDTRLSTSSVVERVGQAVPNKRALIVSDTNEPRLTNEIKTAGYNIQPASKRKNSIIDDIREMQDYEIVVDSESYNLKRELNNYAWNDKKASIPIDASNHLIDGSRYGFRRLVGFGGSGIRRRN